MSDQENKESNDSAEQSTDQSGMPPEVKAAIAGLLGSLGELGQTAKRREARAKCLEYALSTGIDYNSPQEIVTAAKAFFTYIVTDDEADKEASDEQG